jgi:Uma2 family endonuclease
VSPEVVFEVLSPHDRWAEVRANVGECLGAGVLVVCVLDPELRKATVCRANGRPVVLTAEAELELPELHAEFRVLVQKFFG